MAVARFRRDLRVMPGASKVGASAEFAKLFMAFTSSSSKGVGCAQPKGRESFEVIGFPPRAAVVKGWRARETGF